MGVGAIVALVVLAVVVIVLVWAVMAYNRLVTLRNRVENGYSQIDVQLKRRTDLVPNLIETVKGYATHESQVFQNVTEARAEAMKAADSVSATPADRAQAESALTNALLALKATAEAYPDLKANQNFLQLQDQLSDLEQKIAYARQFYNDVVQKLNTAIQTFPSNVIAGMFHFAPGQYFQVAEADRQVPQVKF
ncbi:LemA family protein [Bifidobacterium sp. ESL0763]|uniref:LemA family protein n=1 Tax=Bifidobacterium sp. ESL0763 TaxID=2983227 RepID=UPI0023F8118D|nr:LemA family protein [Bifidobacterium sp. ESL0763]MDF7663374.1 LemA family protein [Bifidobacterium sp. ESL0763]